MLKSASALLFATALAVLGAATTAQAEPHMYSGSLILDEFANDTTDGTTYPFNAYVVLGIPHGLYCNAKQGGKDGPCYGGTNDAARDGMPLTGSGTAAVTGLSPRNFTIPASDLSRVLGTFSPTTGTVCGLQDKGKLQIGCNPGGSFSYYPPYIYSFEFADLRNQAGDFFGGGGNGNFTFTYTTGATARVSGSTGFGGTMRLLGFYKTVSASSVANPGVSLAYATQTWVQSLVGATPTTVSGGVSLQAKATTFNAYFTGLNVSKPQTVIATGFPWTVGTASVTLTARGPFPTIVQRVGYDSRNATGSGTIQLVSPILHHWFNDGAEPNDTGGIGILNLVFAPEPDKSLMLAAGLGLLGVLWVVSRRNR